MTKNVTTLDDDSKPAAPKTADGKLAPKQGQSAEFSGKKSMISIAISKEDGGRDAVFVGVQGVGFQVPRGKQWEVPIEVAEALSNATEWTYHRDEVTGVVERRESPRFAFTRMDLVETAAA